MDYSQLETLSSAALSSPYQVDRDSAADALRYLTSYDCFPYLRKAILEIPDEALYSCIILSKALKFVVVNELGPSERQEMQELSLGLVARRVRSSHFLSPPFIIKSILSIHAAGLFLNFRLMLFGSKEGNQSTQQRPELGEKALGQLLDFIGADRPDVVLMAMTEIILHFNSEEKKNQTTNLRRAFATEIIPSFFTYAVGNLNMLCKEALELCAMCLELVPTGGSAPLISIAIHTDDSLYLHPATAWLPPLRELASYCATCLTSSSSDEGLVSLSQQILRSMSCAVFTDWRDGSSLLTLTDGFFKALMPVATSQIRRFISTLNVGGMLHRDDILMLEHAIAMAVNIFERNDLFVGSYVYNNMDIFISLAAVAKEFKNRMVATGQVGENNILGKLLHLFYVVGERGVPPPPLPGSYLQDGGSNPQPPEDPIRTTIVDLILSVTVTYLDTIVETAHLAEENYDLSREGFLLNLDSVLTPMAEMLFSEVVDVLSVVDAYLSRTLAMQSACVSLKSGNPNGTPDQAILNELDYLAVSAYNGASISTQVGVMLVTRLVLSRLSILISLIGLAVKLRSGRGHRLGSEDRLADQSLALEVMHFIANFISPDHNITDMMLQCMTIGDEGQPQGDGMGGPSFSNSSANAMNQLHLPILRSLIYFCSCLHDTWISKQPQFLEITAELLSFSLIDHGDCFSLASDANLLVRRLLEEHTALTALQGVRHIIEEHWNCNIMLTRNDFTATDPDARKLRSRTLTNIVKLSEARADVQLQQFIPQLVSLLTVEKDLELFIEDVTSICDGLTYAVSLYAIVNMLVDQKQAIINALSAIPNSTEDRTRIFTKFIKCWSMVCMNCYKLLESDNVHECLWIFASFCFDSLSHVIEDLKARFAPSIEAGRCLIPEQVFFDSCSLIMNTLKGRWCNVGVMMYYGDYTAVNTMGLVIELIVATPVQVLMSDFERSPIVFSAIHSAITASKDFTKRIRLLNAWTDLVPFLMKCMGYRFYDLIASCLLILLNDPTVLIPSVLVSGICSVALVTLTTSPLNEHEVLNLCEILISCHRREANRCEKEFEAMLDTASAYHRVRVRSFLTLLRSGAENAAAQYIEIFGTESTVVTIAGW